ncbi:hypothetical protein CEXT_769251 [Caerostris extrusa]|uniref:Uncharacterized protein n=1 Tax=Caerostris extrusa TaxID=172846 RepID=A0AAV4RY55_CAEEX|nr:hypothetical protein CEXT_769251 [Caerostris extrusa]
MAFEEEMYPPTDSIIIMVYGFFRFANRFELAHFDIANRFQFVAALLRKRFGQFELHFDIGFQFAALLRKRCILATDWISLNSVAHGISDLAYDSSREFFWTIDIIKEYNAPFYSNFIRSSSVPAQIASIWRFPDLAYSFSEEGTIDIIMSI